MNAPPSACALLVNPPCAWFPYLQGKGGVAGAREAGMSGSRRASSKQSLCCHDRPALTPDLRWLSQVPLVPSG